MLLAVMWQFDGIHWQSRGTFSASSDDHMGRKLQRIPCTASLGNRHRGMVLDKHGGTLRVDWGNFACIPHLK